MTTVRAKLFMHGGSQAVRLPKAFRFEGREVLLSREADRVIMEPVAEVKESWEELFARMDAIGAGRDFPNIPRDVWRGPVSFADDALDPTG